MFEINNIEDLYCRYDGYIRNINITVKVTIEHDSNEIKNKFIYNDFIKAANYFINNNPNEYSYIIINNPFNIDDDNICWHIIQDDINMSYKITIELVLYPLLKESNYKYKYFRINKYDDDEKYLAYYI